MRALGAHEYLLWHVKNGSGGARRNAEATLARLATSDTTKADLTALDAPGYVTRAGSVWGDVGGSRARPGGRRRRWRRIAGPGGIVARAGRGEKERGGARASDGKRGA